MLSEQRVLTLVLRDVPFQRLCETSFWVFIFRLWVFPCRKHGPRMLYQVLLPHLNCKQLLATDNWTGVPAAAALTAPGGADAAAAELPW